MSVLLDPERVCEQVLRAVGHIAPPTDLDAVCSLWPNLKVDEDDLDKEGYLIPLGVHGAEILLRRDDPPTRKKFTLAHELGHWTQAHIEADRVSLGASKRPSISFQAHQNRQTPEEVWCNKFAACLLMPKRDVFSYIQCNWKIKLADRISRGHSVFQVSHEAFLNRISDMTPINVFEIVCTDKGAKIRRSFLSKYHQDDQVGQIMGRLLYAFQGTDDPFDEPAVVDGYHVQAKLAHKSRYTRSWLASVTPVKKFES